MSVDEQKSISELFLEAFKIHRNIENTSESTNSTENQKSIKHALKLLEVVTSRTIELHLFSINEEISEISTVNLKYLISPSLCGVLTSLVQTPREERKTLLNSAEIFLHQFLERCKDYGIGPGKEIERAIKLTKAGTSKPNPRDLSAMNAQREAKIARFKRNKELDERLNHLKSVMSEVDDDVTNIDDETVRSYWVSVIEKWVDTSIENLENIAQEKEILGFWENLPDKNNPPAPTPTTSQNNGIPQNFILAKDKAQAAVFGSGYPSLPSMTVEEYFDSHIAAGTLPDQGTSQNSNGINENSDDDNGSDEKVQKQRQFDDWKDTHRRGDGNRKNMG